MSKTPSNGTPNTFLLFKNDYHEEGSRKPAYTGWYFDENGKPHKMDGWVKKKKDGNLFISGQCKDADTIERDAEKRKTTSNEETKRRSEEVDGLPF